MLAVIFGGDLHPAVSAAERLVESAYAREQEHEADAWGLRLVHAAYGTTEGALAFFERVAAARESRAQRLAAFAASHPLTDERLARLRALARELDDAKAR